MLCYSLYCIAAEVLIYYYCPIGSKKSLVDAMGSGINLREEILHMYMRNYHGGAMRLVIIGGGRLQSLFKRKRYFDYKSYP